MEPIQIKEQLITVIDQIQAACGLECPVLNGQTKPVESIPQFDSKIWLVATTILAEKIDETIPNDVNIFVDEDSKLPRNIDEIAAFVCDLVEQHSKAEAA